MTELALPDKIEYAKAIAGSNLLPKQYQKQPANVLVAIEYGHALGIPPISAIQNIYVVDGKPTASAQLIGSLVRNAGHRLRVTGNDEQARAVIVRSDDPDFEFVSVWTIERAQRAGLTGKGVWKQYPAAMLKARAITEVARDACAEVLSGVAYTAEELDAADDHTVELRVEPVTVERTVVTTPEETPWNAPAVEVWDAEVVDETPAPADDASKPTRKQLDTIIGLLNKFGVTDLGEVLQICMALTERELSNANDLTRIEASAIIKELYEAKEHPEPLDHLLGGGA